MGQLNAGFSNLCYFIAKLDFGGQICLFKEKWVEGIVDSFVKR